jgi:hypothetical protein
MCWTARGGVGSKKIFGELSTTGRVDLDVAVDFDVNLDLNGVATVDARAFLEPPVSSKSVDHVHVAVAVAVAVKVKVGRPCSRLQNSIA